MSVKSPVVFCHNDLQEGNILLRLDNQESQVSQPELVVIDFEFCSYNYRGFDFANHMCEWLYDYSNENPPYFWVHRDNCPSPKQEVCTDCVSTANPRITRLIRSEKSSRNTKTHKVNN